MRARHLILTWFLATIIGTSARADIIIRNGTNWDSSPAVAYNTFEKKYLVVWSERILISPGIYLVLGPVLGQQVAEDGIRIGTPFQIFSIGIYPAISYNPARNEFLVAASDLVGIQAQRLTGSGVPLGSPTTLMPGLSFARIVYNSLANTYLAAGAKLVDDLSAGTGYYRIQIFTRRLDALGQPVAPAVPVEDTAHGYQPADAMYSVAYAPIASTQTPSGRYLLAVKGELSLLDSNGEVIWAVFDSAHGTYYRYLPISNGLPSGGIFNCDVAFGTDSGYSMSGPAFLVVWADQNNVRGSDFWPGIWGTFVDAAKTEYLTSDPVVNNAFPLSYIFHNNSNAEVQSWRPRVVFNPILHKYVVVWRETPSNSSYNDTTVAHIRGSTAFDQIPPSNRILSSVIGTENPFNPAIASSTTRPNALVVWEDARNHASTDIDIYGRSFFNYLYLPIILR